VFKSLKELYCWLSVTAA